MRNLKNDKATFSEVIPYFLRVFVPFTFLIILAIIIYAGVEGLYVKRLIMERQQQQVELSQESLETDVSGVIRELKYLSEMLGPFIQSDGKVGSATAKKLVRDFADNIKRYDQIRWLNFQGKEVLRIDHRDGRTRIVPTAELQDKSNRYYFTETIKLAPGAVYTSPLDLNVEHGEIELPYRPMLRIAMPTTDANGERNGVLILNYQASRMLEIFARSKHISSGELYLLDKDGYWLYASDDHPTWGFMFANTHKFETDFPETWAKISAGYQGSMECEEGIFSFIPVRESMFAIDGAGDAGMEDEYTELEGRSIKWIVLALYPKEALRGIYLKRLESYGVVLILSLMVLALISWFRGRYILERNSLIDRLALHAKVMESATNGVMITDTTPTIIAVNEAFSKVTGYSEEEIVGKNPSLLASGRHDESYYNEMWESLALRGYWEGEIWNRHKCGELFPEWMSISAIYDHEGKLSNYIGIFSVLAEQQGTEERLRELANSDMLTGLINRNLFYDRATQALAYCRRTDGKAAFMFLDLDGFKPINDTIGHAAGDEVLRIVAQRIKKCLRETDTVARFGGDEFLMLLSSIEDREIVAQLGEKIIQRIREPIDIEGRHCYVSASIGICLYPDDNDTVDGLIRCADHAMYKAKEAGKGRVAFHSE